MHRRNQMAEDAKKPAMQSAEEKEAADREAAAEAQATLLEQMRREERAARLGKAP